MLPLPLPCLFAVHSFNIKCRYSGLVPNCVVLVATVRALKMHGGGSAVVAGTPLPEEYTSENLELVRKGVCNMQHHIRSALKYGVPVVVALNKFTSDTQAEIDIVTQAAKDAGAADAVLANHWAEGGAGAEDLAHAVKKACKEAKRENFKFLYPLDMPLKDKIKVWLVHIICARRNCAPVDSTLFRCFLVVLCLTPCCIVCVVVLNLSSLCDQTIAREMYGAKDVEFSPLADEQLERYTKQGFAGLPICVAKTHVST